MAATRDMATTGEVGASRQQIWDAMTDGWTFAQWVVGNSRTRAVDPHWRRPGSAIKHSVGVLPLVISDQTWSKVVPRARNSSSAGPRATRSRPNHVAPQ